MTQVQKIFFLFSMMAARGMVKKNQTRRAGLYIEEILFIDNKFGKIKM